jgi:hypothetical protein
MCFRPAGDCLARHTASASMQSSTPAKCSWTSPAASNMSIRWDGAWQVARVNTEPNGGSRQFGLQPEKRFRLGEWTIINLGPSFPARGHSNNLGVDRGPSACLRVGISVKSPYSRRQHLPSASVTGTDRHRAGTRNAGLSVKLRMAERKMPSRSADLLGRPLNVESKRQLEADNENSHCTTEATAIYGRCGAP